MSHLIARRLLLAIACVGALATAAPLLRAQEPVLLTRNRTLGTPVSPYDARVSPYSPVGARNPYASTPPVVVYEPRVSAPSAARTRAAWERVEPVPPRRYH